MNGKPDVQSKILTKSFGLFKHYGYKSVSMDDVAGQLNISKKTLYQHFSSKDELLAAGVKKLIGELNIDIRKISDSNGYPLIKISKIYHRLLEEFYGMDLVYIHTLEKYTTKASEEVTSFKQTLISDYTRPLLKEASKKGCIREELDIDLFIRSRLDCIDKLYVSFVKGMPQISPIEIFRHLIVYQLLGVCTEKCRTEYEEMIVKIEFDK